MRQTVDSAKATFLMSTFNAGGFLGPAIDSVLAQTDPRWRLIVVDDGSTDGSAELAAAYPDPRITTVALERNAGQTAALNLGLEMVETPWVARLDQDDLAAPERLARQLAHLDANPETVLLGSWADYIDEHGRPVGRWRPPTDPEAVRRALYTRPCPFAHSAVMYRSDLVRSLGGYPTNFVYAQDLALWAELEAAGTIANVARVLTYLRLHSNQASRDPAALELQISEALSITRRLPEALAGDRRTLRAWRARRLASMAEGAIAAARARQWEVARRHGLNALRAAISDPLAILLIAARGARNAYGKLRGRGSRLPREGLV